MRYANVLLILFLCAISFASESAPLRFAAAEMPKPDPCLPFITETYKWVEKHWPDGATFRYYDVTSLEKAVPYSMLSHTTVLPCMTSSLQMDCPLKMRLQTTSRQTTPVA